MSRQNVLFQCLFQLFDWFPDMSSLKTSIQLVYSGSPSASVQSGLGIPVGYPDSMVWPISHKQALWCRSHMQLTAPGRKPTPIYQVQQIVLKIRRLHQNHIVINNTGDKLQCTSILCVRSNHKWKARNWSLKATAYASTKMFLSVSSSHRTGIIKLPFLRQASSSM